MNDDSDKKAMLNQVVQQLDLSYDEKRLRIFLKLQVEDNYLAIMKLSKNFLKSKSMSMEQYLMWLLSNEFVVDELFLNLLSRRYQVHVGVILNYGFWCTTLWICLHQCKLIFVSTTDVLNNRQLKLCNQVPVDESPNFQNELENFLALDTSISNTHKNVPVGKKKSEKLQINTSFSQLNKHQQEKP